MNKKIKKDKLYEHIEGGVWEIWEGEDFSDGYVLLYETGTGEDMSVKLEDFWKCFKVAS